MFMNVMNYRCRNSASLMFPNDYVNNLTVTLRKSYYSLDKRIQLSCNSPIVQLYEYNIVFPSPLFTILILPVLIIIFIVF